MRIRQAEISDAEEIAVVHVRSWQTAYPGMIPQDYLDALDPALRAVTWRENLAADRWPTSGTLVATDGDDPAASPGDPTGTGNVGDDHIVGFVSVGPSRDADADAGTVGEVLALYLTPEVWGTGTGRRLLGTAVDQLRRCGFAEATLWALRENDRARRFYERAGWVFDGTTMLHDWRAFVATDVRYRRSLDIDDG